MEEQCYACSGLQARINNLEADVQILFTKWDKIQTLIIGTLVACCLNLVGVIFLLIRLFESTKVN